MFRHNTKADDPLKIKSRNGPYSQWTEEEKIKNRENTRKRGLDRKNKLISLSGGKCIRCGYNKTIKALTFHHRNPEEKNFSLGVQHLWSYSWDKVLEEHTKCDLLCMNCHAEVEEEIFEKKRSSISHN